MIRVAIEPGFEAWRDAARTLLGAGTPPGAVQWEESGSAQGALPLAQGCVEGAAARVRVPRAFLELAEAAACHREPGRWALLYRILWRLSHEEPRLMRLSSDPDVYRLLRMEKAVRRAAHKMKAFVRFREVEVEGGPHFVAWFEPQQDVTERTAPFFAERFASMRWSILTPDRCAHWDGERLRFTPGAPRSAAPDGDRLEDLWRTYYASTFNPARVRPRAMRAEMPVGYWHNLPEAGLIAPLLQNAPARVRRMLEEQRAEGVERPRKQAFRSPAEKRAARGGGGGPPGPE